MDLKLTGTHPGGTREVHCPTNRKMYVVCNSTAGDVTLKTVAGTGILVNAGGRPLSRRGDVVPGYQSDRAADAARGRFVIVPGEVREVG